MIEVPYKLNKNGSTVAEIGLAFALLFGCKTIFIQGVDLPIYHRSKDGLNTKYNTFRNTNGDIFEKETNKYLRKKYFF